MANECYFEMKVVANNQESIDKLYKMMTDYDEPRHFRRIFDCVPLDSQRNNVDEIVASFYGNCAWSVQGCMCSGPWTYYDQSPERSISLQEASAELGLIIEVYSSEPGVGFQEHLLYDNGKTVLEEECDFQEYYFEEGYDDWDEWLKEHDLHIEKEDLDDGSYYVGGFQWNWLI